MTLRSRLLFLVVVIVASGLMVLDFVTYTSLRGYLIGQVDHQLPVDEAPMSELLSYCATYAPQACPDESSSGSAIGGGNPTQQVPELLSPGTFGEMFDSSGNSIDALFTGPLTSVPPPPVVSPAVIG